MMLAAGVAAHAAVRLLQLSLHRAARLTMGVPLSPARPGLAEACFLLGLWWLRAAGPRGAEGRDGATAGQALRLPRPWGSADLRRLHLLLRRQRNGWVARPEPLILAYPSKSAVIYITVGMLEAGGMDLTVCFWGLQAACFSGVPPTPPASPPCTPKPCRICAAGRSAAWPAGE